jgi:plastocyanin
MKRLPAALVCVVTLAAGEAYAVAVAGRVTFQTKRGQRPVIEETVVWLEPADGKPARQEPASTQMVTRNKTLLPHVLVVPTGSTVAFPNDDPISHNLFSRSPGNAFDLGLYRKGAGKSQKFDTPGVVNVYCNVHPNMSAVIHVVPSAYYGFADAAGNFTFDVPPGRYRLAAWNEQGGMSETAIEVTERGVTGNVQLTIDSRGFRHAQHKNKEGKPYRPPTTREY